MVLFYHKRQELSNTIVLERKTMTTFSERLASTHKQTGLNQQEAVEIILRRTRVRIPQSTFSTYLRGDKEPPVSTLAVLARGLRVSADYLCGLTKDSRPIEDILKLVSLPDDVQRVVTHLLEMSSSERSELIERVFTERAQAQRLRPLAKLIGTDVDTLRGMAGGGTSTSIDSVEETLAKLS